MTNEIKNVVFDLDGTIIDSNIPSLLSLQQTIKVVENKEFTLEELEIVLGLPDFDVFKVLGIKNTIKCYSLWKKLSIELDNQKHIFPEIIEILEILNNLNINLGIVTSREKERYFNDHLIMNNVNSYFDTIITSESTLKHKPHPEPLLKWIELTNSDPNQTIYIGDTRYDCIAAKRAGVRFGLAAWGLHQSFKNEISFSKPSDILQLFKKEE